MCVVLMAQVLVAVLGEPQRPAVLFEVSCGVTLPFQFAECDGLELAVKLMRFRRGSQPSRDQRPKSWALAIAKGVLSMTAHPKAIVCQMSLVDQFSPRCAVDAARSTASCYRRRDQRQFTFAILRNDVDVATGVLHPTEANDHAGCAFLLTRRLSIDGVTVHHVERIQP